MERLQGYKELQIESFVSHALRQANHLNQPTVHPLTWVAGLQVLTEQSLRLRAKPLSSLIISLQGAHEPVVFAPHAGRHARQHHEHSGLGGIRHQAQVPHVPDLGAERSAERERERERERDERRGRGRAR